MEIDAGEEEMGWQQVRSAAQHMGHLAQGNRAVPCQVMALSQQQVRLCHARAMLQQHLQQSALHNDTTGVTPVTSLALSCSKSVGDKGTAQESPKLQRNKAQKVM